MSITVNDQTYLTAAESARRLGVSRDTFNRNMSPRLRKYKFGALSRTYYLETEVNDHRGPQEIADEPEE